MLESLSLAHIASLQSIGHKGFRSHGARPPESEFLRNIQLMLKLLGVQGTRTENWHSEPSAGSRFSAHREVSAAPDTDRTGPEKFGRAKQMRAAGKVGYRGSGERYLMVKASQSEAGWSEEGTGGLDGRERDHGRGDRRPSATRRPQSLGGPKASEAPPTCGPLGPGDNVLPELPHRPVPGHLLVARQALRQLDFGG